MAVFKRKTSRGISTYYNYRFKVQGKLYYGVCLAKDGKQKATKKVEAEAWEKLIRQKVTDLSKQKTVKAIIENFREEMSEGNPITLDQAFDLSLKKPRKRQPSEKVKKYKRSYWNDFIDYMKAQYPDLKKLSDVRRKHAEEYVQYLRTNGRYNKDVTFKTRGKTASYRKKGKLSNKTCNDYQQIITEVFNLLSNDAGLLENPFSGIPKMKNECESRDAFTEKELVLVRDNYDDFIKAIFCIGVATALREGDICTLKWKEVDFESNVIRRRMSKTNRVVEIPILPPLRSFLEEQRQISSDNEYVLPEHALMYLNNPTGITLRVKRFLEGIGIKTTKKVKGRDRAISIKDVHSLRHTFCYYAGVYGIPFLVVKDIVGHVSPQMTELYQKHADNRLKREKLKQMPDFMGLLPEKESSSLPEDLDRKKLIKLASLADIEKVRMALKILEEKS